MDTPPTLVPLVANQRRTSWVLLVVAIAGMVNAYQSSRLSARVNELEARGADADALRVLKGHDQELELLSHFHRQNQERFELRDRAIDQLQRQVKQLLDERAAK